MLITLAEMSLRASVTLAVLATVIWLPVALLSVRRSAWAWMTFAMIGMLWRGEAWKTVSLAEEAQLSQCLQLLPNTGFYDLERKPACGDAHFARSVPSTQSLAAITPFGPHTISPLLWMQFLDGRRRSMRDTPLVTPCSERTGDLYLGLFPYKRPRSDVDQPQTAVPAYAAKTCLGQRS
jgi:hypothetical protein